MNLNPSINVNVPVRKVNKFVLTQLSTKGTGGFRKFASI